jgi:hypothetical protein
MSMIGIGAAKVAVMLLAIGAMGAMPQVGVPSAPDAGLQSAAPEEVLLYISKSGTDEADPKSSNQVEQLLAEPEVKDFIAEVSRLIDEGLAKVPATNEEERTLSRTLPVVAKTLLANPLMVYVSKVQVPPQMPGASGAIVVQAGDQVKPLVAALEELEQLLVSKMPPNMAVEKFEAEGVSMRRLPTPPGVPPVVWGVQGTYVFIAVGEGEAAVVAKRLAKPGAVPAWLEAVVKEAEIPRVGGIAYVNLAGVLETVEPLLDQIPPGPFEPKKVIEALGVRHLKHAAVVAGLNDEMSVSKLIVRHDGEAKGLLAFLKGQPLSAEDFRRLPDGIDFAMVARFDLALAYEQVLDIAREIEPRSVDEIETGLAQMEDKLGFSVKDDLFAGLGNLITVYNSASEGGLLGTGLCASIGVKDRSRVEKIIEKLRRLAESEQNRERPEFAIRKSEVGGQTIHYVQFLREPIPVAPSWCLTDDELVVGITPQMVRAHVTRKGGGGFLKSSGLDKHLARGDVTGVSYVDVKLVYQLLYSYANLGVCAGASALEKETGIRADLTKFPSYGSISRHMRPTLSISRGMKDAWIAETYTTGPNLGAGTLVSLSAASLFGVRSVDKATATATMSVSNNTLRQIGLAAFQKTAIDGKPLARAITDDDGKPLLSWRVAILPHLDQLALYQQFHLDEPWDSEHNLPLSKRLPSVFANYEHGELSLEGKTLYQIPHGKGALYQGIAGPDDEVFDEAPGGRSGTVLMVETLPEFAVIWTKPDDVEISEVTVRHRLNLGPGGTASVLFADQHLERLSIISESPDRISRMFFPRGGGRE